jgi:hypothetical protein
MGCGIQTLSLVQLPLQHLLVPHSIKFSVTSQKYRFNDVYPTRPRSVTDLKLKHNEQNVAFMSLETTRRHISTELSLL